MKHKFNYSQAQIIDEPELDYFLEALLKRNYIFLRNQDDWSDFHLTVDGWKKFEEITPQISSSKRVFIAMWFDDSLNIVYENAIVPAIKSLNLIPVRIDKKDHNNKIDDEIIYEIRRSKLIIADFTGQRGGVYFEAGFAKGLGIPVIFTCKKTEEKELHFDTRQYNHILWEDDKLEKLKEKLVGQISNTIGISHTN